MSLTRFRCANSLETPTSGWFYDRGGPPVETKKLKGPCGNRTRDLSHPKGESYL